MIVDNRVAETIANEVRHALYCAYGDAAAEQIGFVVALSHVETPGDVHIGLGCCRDCASGLLAGALDAIAGRL